MFNLHFLVGRNFNLMQVAVSSLVESAAVVTGGSRAIYSRKNNSMNTLVQVMAKTNRDTTIQN